ncbi:MAG: hypothetical protein K8W52_15575 [Deltaproteobacteria bacterium]|nr:hypothetical protein [Deltaproteobacteria bacterium]
MSAARRALAVGLGAGVVAAHALALPRLLAHFARPDLEVAIDGPAVAPSWSLRGTAPVDLGPRLTVDLDGAPLTGAPVAPGLHYLRFTTHYRGGFERRVGAVQLVGPFQDPAHPPCSTRVIVGQRFLDDGHAGPGTVAHAVKAELTRQLRGMSAFPVGDFVRVSDVKVAWAERKRHPEDLGLLRKDDPHGYARATATVELDRVSVPITVALIPKLEGDNLRFLVRVRAKLEFGNRFFDWVSDRFDGDAFATNLAREQIGAGLITALGPPPPLELPGGHTLRFRYCGEAPSIGNNGYASLPLAVAIGDATGAEHVLPPRYGAASTVPPVEGTVLALDLDLDALNALLYELWRVGYLDAELERVGLHRRFNDDPTVQELLSIRLSPVTLALPPVVSARATPTGPGLRLAAAAQLTIGDGDHAVAGRVWGGLDLDFHRGSAPAVGVDVGLGPLELTCLPSPHQLVPCYADLVAALRDRAGELHGTLTDAFAAILTSLFVDRKVAAEGMPGALTIRGVRASIPASGPSPENALVRLELDATLVE